MIGRRREEGGLKIEDLLARRGGGLVFGKREKSTFTLGFILVNFFFNK